MQQITTHGNGIESSGKTVQVRDAAPWQPPQSSLMMKSYKLFVKSSYNI